MPIRKRLAAIVTYFPDENLPLLVSDLEGQVDHLLIVDNGSRDNLHLGKIANKGNDWISIVPLGTNQGIAKALNIAVLYARENNFEYLLTLDQDSRLPNAYTQSMLKMFHQLEDEEVRVGLLAPNFIDINAGTQARFSVISRGWTRTVVCEKPEGYIETQFAITSGSIYSVEVFAEVGNFREDFFIDHVDTEFCLRLASKGYRIFVNCGVCLQHAIGQRTVHKFLGLTIKPNHHRALRRYYIARNGVYLSRLYLWRFPANVWLNIMRLMHEFLSIAVYEQNRSAKLGMFMRGILDGLRGRMGELPR